MAGRGLLDALGAKWADERAACEREAAARQQAAPVEEPEMSPAQRQSALEDLRRDPSADEDQPRQPWRAT